MPAGHEQWRLAGDTLVGAWLKQGRDRTAELGVIAGEHIDDPRLAAPGGEALYCVHWETSGPTYVTAAEIYEGEDPGRARLLPVLPSSGRPALVLVTGGGLRQGECGIVIYCTPKGYGVRYLPEYTDAGTVIRRSGGQQFGTVTSRLDHYSIQPCDAPAPGAFPDFLVHLLTAVDRARLLASNPDHRAAIRLLTSPGLTVASAETFVGRGLSRVFDGLPISARVTSLSVGALGHIAFEVLYDDGDTARLTPVALAESMTWQQLGLASPTLQRPRGTSPAHLRSQRPLSTPAPTTPAVQTCTACGTQWTRARSSSAIHELCTNCDGSGGDPFAIYPDFAAALHASARKTRRRAAAPTAASCELPGDRAPAPAYVAKHLDQSVYDDLRAGVLEGLDVRLRPEFLENHPPIPRGRGLAVDLDHAEAFVDRRWGRAPRARGLPRTVRWDRASAGDTARLIQIVTRFAAVKASSMSTYDSNRHGYEQHCRTLTPTRRPYPLEAATVGTWLLRRWAKGLKSNLSNTKPLVSSLTHHCVHVLGQHLDVTPYPGMALVERLQLRRICRALAELEDQAIRRSIPLTAQLLRLVIAEGAVPLDRLNNPTNAADVAAVRDVARYGLCRVAMLRKNDTIAGKLNVGAYTLLEGSDGALTVAPGKSHHSSVIAEVPGAIDPTHSLQDWLRPGYAMKRWLLLYQDATDGALAEHPDWPLFPKLDEHGTPTLEEATPDGLQATIRAWLSSVGLPAAFVDRVTLHGFRSGGCTDAINSKIMTSREIQRQGRWSSDAFEMYVHLKADAVRETLRDVIAEIALTRAERKTKALVEKNGAEKALVRKWAAQLTLHDPTSRQGGELISPADAAVATPARPPPTSQPPRVTRRPIS